MSDDLTKAAPAVASSFLFCPCSACGAEPAPDPTSHCWWCGEELKPTNEINPMNIDLNNLPVLGINCRLDADQLASHIIRAWRSPETKRPAVLEVSVNDGMCLYELLNSAGLPISPVWVERSGNKRPARTTSDPRCSTTNEEPSPPSQACPPVREAMQSSASDRQPRSVRMDSPSGRTAPDTLNQVARPEHQRRGKCSERGGMYRLLAPLSKMWTALCGGVGVRQNDKLSHEEGAK